MYSGFVIFGIVVMCCGLVVSGPCFSGNGVCNLAIGNVLAIELL